MSEYSVNDIIRAKQIAREAGYSVSLPDNQLDIAKNIARANGYQVEEPDRNYTNPSVKGPAQTRKDDIDQAMRVAIDAGYSVSKAPLATPATREQPGVDPKIQQVVDKNTRAAQELARQTAEAGQNGFTNYSWVEKMAAKYL